ncbi:hypothetical protein [Amycolatopsis sp. NPDC051128]|uniref:hypothetical protein n=1 Tax=Amycolatopsis sp. NPDC051128 TaxID=3155412 RepID=UPI00343B440D
MQDRDRELIKTLRRIAERTAEFIERAESDEIGELAFADALDVLTPAYRDIAGEMSARSGALYATNLLVQPRRSCPEMNSRPTCLPNPTLRGGRGGRVPAAACPGPYAAESGLVRGPWPALPGAPAPDWIRTEQNRLPDLPAAAQFPATPNKANSPFAG